MAKYEKWLGAGLGWMVTGNPVGGLVGFVAGGLLGSNRNSGEQNTLGGVTEFEANLIVLASHLIKIDGRVCPSEISFTHNFLDNHFEETLSIKRLQVINHCLQKEYDLTTVCDRLRMYTSHSTRVQVVHFLFDLAACDYELNERENYFIFRIAGFLNVNDVDFKKIKKEHKEFMNSEYATLGVEQNASMAEITNAYRRLVLQYHPDKHTKASTEERKELARKFQIIQEAYKKIKKGRST